MPLHPYLEKQALDWCFKGAAATQPAGVWVQFATATPTSQSAFDGPFSSRFTVSFAGANSPQGSVTNLNAVTGAVASVSATVVGFNIYDASAAGSRLAWGTFSASLGCKSGSDQPAYGAGALKITLS